MNIAVNNSVSINQTVGASLTIRPIQPVSYGLVAVAGPQGPQGPVGPAGTGASAGGVSSLNGLTGSVSLGGAQGISISPSGQTIFVSGQDWALNTNLTQTGVALVASIGSLSGFVLTTSGTLQTANQASGSQLYRLVTGLSGQSAIDYATATNLTLTGQTLQGRINSLSGFVGGVSGGLEARLTASGNSTVIHANGIGSGLSGSLGATGQTLYQILTGFSGQSNLSYATAANLAITGSNLYVLITGLSGQDATDYATKVQLTNSGVTLGGAIVGGDTNLSGALTQTGVALGAKINVLSGWSSGVISGGLENRIIQSGNSVVIHANGIGSGLSGVLTTTGQNLYQMMTGLSGQANLNYATIANLATTGSNLYVLITGLSGQANTNYATATNLALTGSNLYVTLTGLSGQANLNFATITNLALTGSNLYVTLTGASGQFNTNLVATGNAAVNHANGIGVNLSGALTQTGVTLGLKIDNLSGFTTGVSGALQALIAGGGSLVRVTGSSNIAVANFTGIGNVAVVYSGGLIFVSGAAGAGGGVTSLNGLAGAVVVAGTGGLTVSTAGQNILVSGDQSISGALTQTGATLGAQIAGLSGVTLALYGLNLVYTTGNQNVGGLKTFGTGLFSGDVQIGVPLVFPDSPIVIGRTGVYLQVVVQNLSSGSGASTDFVATSDIGSDTSGYLDVGINSSIYNQTGYSIGSGNDGYVSINGGHLVVGTDTVGKVVRLYVGGPNYNNMVATVDPTGLAMFIDKSVRVSGYGRFISGATDISNLYYPMSNPSGFVSGTLLANTGSNLYVLITGMSGQDSINYATVTNVTLTGQTLFNMVVGGDTNLSGNLTLTGVTLRALTLGGDTNLSGSLTTTGQTLYGLITAASGQANINYASAAVNYVYQTGVQSITGIKTFLSELRFNSGVKTPAQFFGPANYTLTSGNYVVIATGTTSSTTGILPSSTDYSGVAFQIINGGSASLQISGVIGPDINPILAPWDVLQAYATSGQWWYIRQTGSPFLGMITSLSGYVGGVSGALQTNITANSTNLSGNLTTTGQTLFNLTIGGDTNLSGNLTLTGQTLRALTLGGDTNLSGNLTSTGQFFSAKATMPVSFNTASLTWSTMPSITNFFNASSLYRTYVDLSQYTGVNLAVTISTAGATSGALFLRYTNDPANVTVASYWPLTASGAEIYTRLETANIIKQSGFSPIVAGAKSGVYIALMGQSGNGVASPIFGPITAIFK